MNIEIKCTQEQKEKIKDLLKVVEKEITWEVVEMGCITDEEIDVWGKFSDYEKNIIKKQYSKYPKGFFPNPICALH
jgi:hypothetical protein